MKKLELERHQYIVLHAEFATGKVLNLDKKTYFNSDDEIDMFLIFEAKKEGLFYMKNVIILNSEIECSMWNSEREHIITLDTNGERK